MTSVVAIRVAELKNQPLGFLMERLEEAYRNGSRRLDVLNRGRPILHLALASDLPDALPEGEPMSLPLTDLKRSRVSLLELRRDGRAILLTQRSGPTLALWPVTEDYARPAETAQAERLDYLERELNHSRRESRQLEQRLAKLEGNLSAISLVFARLFQPPMAAVEKDRQKKVDPD